MSAVKLVRSGLAIEHAQAGLWVAVRAITGARTERTGGRAWQASRRRLRPPPTRVACAGPARTSSRGVLRPEDLSKDRRDRAAGERGKVKVGDWAAGRTSLHLRPRRGFPASSAPPSEIPRPGASCPPPGDWLLVSYPEPRDRKTRAAMFTHDLTRLSRLETRDSKPHALSFGVGTTITVHPQPGSQLAAWQSARLRVRGTGTRASPSAATHRSDAGR
ncbi:hypothetical protein C8Q78DRAFT_306209 [Trametes maxima]|nr:hypothetical protein C8Q78DRAFT_306209 [Trametes maxima]